jgi:hypothetical protein
MIVHKIFLTCDADGCEEEIYLSTFEHKRQIHVIGLRHMAELEGWVTRKSNRGELSYCPEHAHMMSKRRSE